MNSALMIKNDAYEPAAWERMDAEKAKRRSGHFFEDDYQQTTTTTTTTKAPTTEVSTRGRSPIGSRKKNSKRKGKPLKKTASSNRSRSRSRTKHIDSEEFDDFSIDDDDFMLDLTQKDFE